MKNILIAVVVLSILAAAIAGCLLIFDAIPADVAISYLTKFIGATALLGACSALVAFLLASNKAPPTDNEP